jgi:hypothetical protein
MHKKPLRRKCKYGCGLIPIHQYDDHIYCHEAQTTLIDPKQYEIKTEPKSKARRKQYEGLA